MKIYKFEAEWCHQCKAADKHLTEWQKKNPEVEVIKVDIELNEEFASKFNIRTLPTFIFVSNEDEELHRECGILTPVQLDLVVDQYIHL